MASKDVSSLGELPSGAVHCQRNVPATLAEQERVRLGEILVRSNMTGREEKTENVGTWVVRGNDGDARGDEVVVR